ncbi:MAG: GC-type dockerin domain-anchored protein [Planctomycetota bacterium]
MKNKLAWIAALAAPALVAGTAMAQNTGDFNGGFEDGDMFDDFDIANWREFNGARRRTLTDGASPPALVRSGDASVELPPNAIQPFIGADTNEFNIDTLSLNDPAYVYDCGPGIFTAWYAIPASSPLMGIDNGGMSAGLKLEFRRANSSIYFAFEDLTIEGDTNGEWMPISLTVTEADWLRIFDELNMGEPYPDFPIATSLLVFRFGDTSDQGTIFFDDLEWSQMEYDPADLTEDGLGNGRRDGLVTLSDFSFYLSLWSQSDLAADFTTDGTGNGIPDNAVTLSDFSFYLSLWSTANSTVEPSCF